jgi:hypothetical protein
MLLATIIFMCFWWPPSQLSQHGIDVVCVNVDMASLTAILARRRCRLTWLQWSQHCRGVDQKATAPVRICAACVGCSTVLQFSVLNVLIYKHQQTQTLRSLQRKVYMWCLHPKWICIKPSMPYWPRVEEKSSSLPLHACACDQLASPMIGESALELVQLIIEL